MADCYDVRLNPRSGHMDGVTIFDAKGHGVDRIPVRAQTLFCFKPDYGNSSVTGFVIELDDCDQTCAPVPSSPGAALTLKFTSSASPASLLLKAKANNVYYYARNNLPGTEGGKPIIRGLSGGITVILVAALAIAIIGLVVWRVRSHRSASEFPTAR